MNQQDIENRPLSYSSLKEFKVSPRHFVYYREQPRTPPSDAQIKGQAVECLLLEKDRFDKKFLIVPEINRRTNDGKEQFAQLLQQAIKEGKTMITAADKRDAQDAADVALKNPELVELIAGKRFMQKKLEWRERATNLPINGFIDFDTNIDTGLTCVEMKTARSAELSTFSRDAVKFGYPIQIGTYAIGYMKTRFEFPNFVWAVIETTPPYGCNIISIPKKEVEIFKGQVLGLLSAFRICLDQNKFDEDYRFWNFEMRKYQTFFLPKWAQSSIFSPEETDED